MSCLALMGVLRVYVAQIYYTCYSRVEYLAYYSHSALKSALRDTCRIRDANSTIGI